MPHAGRVRAARPFSSLVEPRTSGWWRYCRPRKMDRAKRLEPSIMGFQ
jgi:hypothetical protein